MDAHEINDVRTDKEFRGKSFSNYKKTQVKKVLQISLTQGKVEDACYWAAELICAGHFIDLWELIITFVSRNVHLGCPKLPLYISLRMNAFKNVVSNGYGGNELALRNNTKIRRIFAEIIAILCYARKKHAFESVKIKKTEEFSMQVIATKLKAPDVSYATLAFREGDPKELFVAVNEFSYHLSSKSRNGYSACYWLEWLLEFDAISKKNKTPLISESRTWPSVDSKYQKDSIWIIWDTIRKRARERNNETIIKIIDALSDMFCLRFTYSTKKKRKYLIYNAISLLTDVADLSIPIWNDKKVIMNVVEKIDIIYKQIKKNEKAPATSYLFNGVAERSNLDKTRERLEMMNSLMGNPSSN